MRNLKIIIVFLVSIIAALYFSQKRNYNGTVVHQNRKYGNINIYRDDYGIPHIEAGNLKDVCYGQGYSVGQDRLFSTFMKKIVGQGRMSEFLGEKMLERDIYFRQLGTGNIDKSKKFKEHQQECLQAYADGINDFANSLYILPIEFYVIGAKWENWTVDDCSIVKNLMSLMLSRDSIFEFQRHIFNATYGFQKTLEFFSLVSEYQFMNTPVINDDELKAQNLYEYYNRSLENQKLEEILSEEQYKHKTQYIINNQTYNLQDHLYEEMISTGGGSNSFVISGKYTKNKKPIFEFDPHLSNGMPSMWSQIELLFEHENKTQHIFGYQVTGHPSIAAGRLNDFAYGSTVSYADTSDFYEETIFEGPDGELLYLVDQNYYPLKKRQEELKIKNQENKIITVLETHRGPIIDIFPNNAFPQGINFKKNSSFAWINKQETTLMGLLIDTMINNITGEDMLRKIQKEVVSYSVGLSFATRGGDIGFIATGSIPIRQNQIMGAFFKDGSTSKDDWIRFPRSDEQPKLFNPEKGYIVSANNKFATDNMKNRLSLNMYSTPRAARIEEMIKEKLGSKKYFEIEDAIEIQNDVLDIYVKNSLPGLIKLFYKCRNEKILNQEQFDASETLIKELEKWDFRFTEDSVGAGIFVVWEYQFMESIFLEISDKRLRDSFTKGFNIYSFIFRKFDLWGQDQKVFVEEEWCSEQNQNNCIKTLFLALFKTQQYLLNNFGENVNNYQHNKIRTTYYPHLALNKFKLPFPFYKPFDREHPGYGNGRTVSMSFVHYDKGTYTGGTGPNMRFIVSFGETLEEDVIYSVIDGGISENIFSPHYDDQLKLHRNFQYVKLKLGKKSFKDHKNKLSIIRNE